MITTYKQSLIPGLNKLDGTIKTSFDPIHALNNFPRQGNASNCTVIEEPVGNGRRPHMTLKDGTGKTILTVDAMPRNLRDVMWRLEGKTIGSVSWQQQSERYCEIVFKPRMPVNSENRHGFIVIDTETTGFKPGFDEILQLSIVDQDGNTLWNRLYKPENRDSWLDAEMVNHISPQMVADKPHIKEDLPEIQKILDDAGMAYAWNAPFDFAFLGEAGLHFDITRAYDTMSEYGQKYHSTHWYKLANAAEEQHYTFQQHDSLNDAKATLYLQNIVDGKQPSSYAIGSSKLATELFGSSQTTRKKHAAGFSRGKNWILLMPTVGFVFYSILMWILIAFDLFLLMGSLFTPPVFALSAPVTALLAYPVYLMFWGYRNR